MYLDKTKDNNIWAVDIEGDGLPSTIIWCITARNIGTREEVRLRDYDSIRRWFQDRPANTKYVAHNGIGYDFPTLNRIIGTRITMDMIIDTMVMSMHYSPSIDGGHSLEAWGKRLRFPKTGYDDFSKYTPEMEEYCMNDTRLLALLFVTLRDRMLQVGFTDVGVEIEHRSWQLIQQQQKNGFAFNIEGAHLLYAKLREIQNDLTRRIEDYWPPKLELIVSYDKSTKKNGSYTANYLRHRDQYVDVRLRPDGGYDCYDYVHFNIGSPPQRLEKLLELGWKNYPDEVTKTGNPSPTKKGKLVPSLEKFVEDSGKEEVRLIARWMEIYARANNVNTWIEAYDDTTKCIHGRLWLANTLRYRHSDPNTANIPAVRLGRSNEILRGEDGAFTYEARDLWTCRGDDRILIGIDAKGIQLRVLAHYLNNKDFIDAVLGGDPHSYNQEIGGFATRAIAKTFIYAFLLGCGDAKAGQIIGGSTRDGREIKTRFVNNFPGLSNLLSDLDGQIRRSGRIRLCDGTPLIVTHPHTRLGYLLQGDESRIMKKAAILTAAEVRRRKLDVLKVGDIHDEHQYDALQLHSEEFANDVTPKTFHSSGEYFNYRLPIDCSSMIGRTWAETH